METGVKKKSSLLSNSFRIFTFQIRVFLLLYIGVFTSYVKNNYVGIHMTIVHTMYFNNRTRKML